MELVGETLRSDYGYRTINFNAWKYRSTPELWAALYQAFVESFVDGKQYQNPRTCQRWRNLVPRGLVERAFASRAALSRHSFLSLLLTSVSLLVLVLPTAYLLNVAAVLISLIGISWLLYFYHLKSVGERTAESVLNASASSLVIHRGLELNL